MRILLDTNVLVRAASGPPSPAEELLRICLTPPQVLCFSPFLFSEVSRVLRYPRVQRIHGMSEEKIDSYLRFLQAGSLMVTVPADAVETVVPNDPKDDPIVATAVAAKAEVICTLDRHLHQEAVVLYCDSKKIEVVTDIELLHRLRPAAP